ncbi:class I SAM-dependent methyltransferase [Isosphaeraceae bacterium EP7]
MSDDVGVSISPRAASNGRGALDGLYAAIHRIRPVRRALDLLRRVAPGLPGQCTRLSYEAFCTLDKRREILFMNYGYAAPGPDGHLVDLGDDDAVNRFSIQLYHRVAGAVDLAGKDVLEVGSGRGGGASYVARCLGPRSVTGVDFAHKAVQFCTDQYKSEGLSFRRGDACHLPFDAGTFDAVLNVESSCHYPSMDAFLGEVSRVLRPGGHLLFADLRHPDHVPELREQFNRSGLVVVQEERITPNVLHALDLDSRRRLEALQRQVPRLIFPLVKDFAGIKGSPVYESFASGECEYLRFVLQKTPRPT